MIDEIAAAAREHGDVRIKLMAHADRAGSKAYNEKLSRLRALVVAKELAARGVPGTKIEKAWFGETRPPVPTADGVREARNRVVRVVLEQ